MNSPLIQETFSRLEKLTTKDGHDELQPLLQKLSLSTQTLQQGYLSLSNERNIRHKFLDKIIQDIDILVCELKTDSSILVSVRNQKILRTCFQIITSIGISACLLPGVGISLSKRCVTAPFLPSSTLDDEEKYKLLVAYTEFFTRCYTVPVFKNIIITFHLVDYLAALIQLTFAPFKKPGTYKNFTMSQERFDELLKDRQRFLEIYHHLVENCFQPILMKELLILQAVKDPSPPAFVRNIVSKQLNNRLLAPGGLLSLIRCFIESYHIDTGYEWQKVHMISKIVACKHGTSSENDYLENICKQITMILSFNNKHYLTTAVACVLSLNEKYPKSASVIQLLNGVFQALDYNNLISKPHLPGTIILSPEEVDHHVNILEACVDTMKLNWPIDLILSNLYVIFQIGMKCTKNLELKIKIKDILIKCIITCNEDQICAEATKYLFGTCDKISNFNIEEFEAGIAIKCVDSPTEYPKNEALSLFLELIHTSAENIFVESIFTVALHILVDLTVKRESKSFNDLLALEDNPEIIDEIDQQYAIVLQLLTEISTSPKVITSLKKNVLPVLDFIEFFLLKRNGKLYEECVTIALVLLNTILSDYNNKYQIDDRSVKIIPVLQIMASDTSSFNSILCKEALRLISSEQPSKAITPCEKAIADVFDSLLPVRAHGIINLTKLINAKDAETISKKHYIFCLFQEQLKDKDSYIYLAAVNGIAALGIHCTEDVLHVLCKEFLQISSEQKDLHTQDLRKNVAETRMKIGDIIVKVTNRLGEMAVVHRTVLLNTMLCACRDEDPFIRTSALSNLAEIALVLHYRIGSIIYEILLCIWGVIESDNAIECRRAAVMVISSLLKGLGKDTLIQMKENLLPIYRTLKNLHNDPCEDSVVRLHSQIALEELNEIVTQFLFPKVNNEKQTFVLSTPDNIIFK